MNIEPGAVADAANKVTITGGGVALWGGVDASLFAALAGVLIAVGGFLVNLYFRRKDDLRSQALHDARMAELREP